MILGYLVYDGKTISMECTDDEGGGSFSALSLLHWQDEMKAQGYIMLPMVWRSGACVAIDEDTVGCLVPPEEIEDLAHDGNFVMEGLEYRALTRFGVQQKIPVMTMLQTLLPIGSKLYLKLESQSAAPILRRLTVEIHVNDLKNYALQVHLSAPNILEPETGKVFVVCLACKMNGNIQSVKGSASEVLLADPWDLVMQQGERKIFKFLVL